MRYDNIRPVEPDVQASVVAAWIGQSEVIDRVTHPEAREVERLLYPPPRHHSGWTRGDDEQLMALWKTGASYIELAHETGRTVNAVRQRMLLLRAELIGK